MIPENNQITRQIRIGNIYMIYFEGNNNEQSGYRPGLVIQNNAGNRFSPNLIVLPLTSSIKKQSQPTHVVIKADDSGLRKDSMVICENPVCISKNKLGRYVTTLSNDYMSKIAEAYILATSVISFLPIEMMAGIMKKAINLNSVSV